jgi:hypothetical protein
VIDRVVDEENVAQRPRAARTVGAREEESAWPVEGPVERSLGQRVKRWANSSVSLSRKPLGELRAHPQVVLALKALGFAFSVALVAYVTAGAVRSVDLDQDDLVLLATSLVPAVVSWVALGRAWACLSGAPSTSLAIASWTRTQALRYLPGSVWAPVARATSVEGAPITKTSAVVVEAGLTAAVGAGVGGVAMASSGKWLWGLLLLVPAVATAVLAAVLPRAGIPRPQLTAAIGWYVFSWIAYGGSVLLTQAALGPLHDVVFVMAAGCLARVAGNVALFSPGGIGVRELVYVSLVSTVLPHGQADAGAITTRLVLTIAELAVLVAVGAPRRAERARRAELANRARRVERTGHSQRREQLRAERLHAGGPVAGRGATASGRRDGS